VISMMACSAAPRAPTASTPPSPRPRIQLAVIPAESNAFPRAAEAVTGSLAGAAIGGIDEMHVSRVPLEVVQLAIECVDPTDICYQAIGRSMSVNRLLFARIDPGATRRQLKVTVTLYDVDAKAARRTAEKLFITEDQAVAGAAALVAEATR
jgi:hypothetical protein